MKKISIISACYNESANIRSTHARIALVMQGLPNYDYEHIFVDNTSTDNSREIFKQVVAEDHHVHVIFMARNSGNSQPSMMAGLRYATGDGVVIIDGDLQDPPEIIPQFVTKWEEGYDVVYGVRKKRSDALYLRICYRIFYRIFKFLSYLNIPLDAGDFGIMSRRVVNVITALPEKDLYLRGLRAWAGFKQTGVPYVRDARAGGITSNNFFANITWFKRAIINFSYKPLELISHLAFFSVFATFCLGCFYLYRHFSTGAPQGFSTLLMFVFIFGSLQLLALAVIAEYLIRIFQEVKNRPAYIIEEIIGQPQSASLAHGAYKAPTVTSPEA